MKFSIKDFFNECDQICSFLWIGSHLLKKSLMENNIFVQCNLHYRYRHRRLSLCTRAPRLSSIKKRSKSVNVTGIPNGLNCSRNSSIRSRDIHEMFDEESK